MVLKLKYNKICANALKRVEHTTTTTKKEGKKVSIIS